MGEAVYSLKATWDRGLTETEQTEILEFLEEGERAADYWQDNRMLLGGFANGRPATQEFWKGFRKQFPHVYEYLGPLAGDKSFGNSLAGELSFVKPTDAMDCSIEFIAPGRSVLYYQAEVWHLTSWDRLAEYLKSRWGAKLAGYSSSEWGEVDPYPDF